MAKQIVYKDEARKKLKAGIDAVCDAVKVTIGPRGRNVAFDRGYGTPMLTNDGVSIAREISLEDKFENMGADFAKEVASKTNDVGGDGTTTSIVLFQSMVAEGMKYVATGYSAMGVRAGIERAAGKAVAVIKEMARPVETDQIEQVATISAEDQSIGKIISDTIQKVGKDGVVTVQESPIAGITSDVVEGMEIDKGYISAYLVNDTERMETVLENPAILITDRKISSIKEFLPFLEKFTKLGKKELVIIADDVDGELLGMLIVNKLRGNLNVLAVRAPAYGERRKEMLQDIAVITGATVISKDVGMDFDKADVTMLGSAGKVVSTKDKTTIIEGGGKTETIKGRIDALKKQAANIEDKFQKEHHEERIAKLTSGVAVIKVGAATETEMKYLKLKIEDAVNATKAALEEGIVPGGGSALILASERIMEDIAGEVVDEDMLAGFQIVKRALQQPFIQIMENAGNEDYSSIASRIKMKDIAGFDAKKGSVILDMYEAGIIDPAKVTRSAIEHASSTAAMFLTMEVAIADIPKKKENELPTMPQGE